MFSIPVILSFLGVLYEVSYKKNQDYFFWFIVFISALISGVRVNVGKDFDNYRQIFEGNPPININEYFFILFGEGINNLGLGSQLGFLVSSFVTIFGVGYFINYVIKKNRFFVFHLYITIPLFYINSLNLLRSNLAISIALVSIVFFVKREKIKFLFFSFIAFLTHYVSAIIFFSFLIFKNFNLTKSIFIVFSLVGIFIFLLFFEKTIILGTPYEYFLYHESNNSELLFLLFSIISLLMFFLNISLNDFPLKRWLIGGSLLTFFFTFLWKYSELANLWLRIGATFYIFVLVSVGLNLHRIKPVIFRNLLIVILSFITLLYYSSKFIQDPYFGYGTS